MGKKKNNKPDKGKEWKGKGCESHPGKGKGKGGEKKGCESYPGKGKGGMSFERQPGKGTAEKKGNSSKNHYWAGRRKHALMKQQQKLLNQEEVPFCGAEIEIGGTEKDDLYVPQIHQIPRVVKSASKEDEGKAANSVFKRIEPHLPNILKRMHEIDMNISSMTGDEIATQLYQENLAKQKLFILMGTELP